MSVPMMGSSGEVRSIVGIDLSARHSAAIVLGAEDTVVAEVVLDAGPKTDPWQSRIFALNSFWDALSVEVDGAALYAIEDIHPFAVDPSQGFRLSGALLQLMYMDTIESYEFIKVSQWQSWHGKKRSDKGKMWARVRAEELGYVPNRKQWKAREREDLVDAFLIAHYVAHREDSAPDGG